MTFSPTRSSRRSEARRAARLAGYTALAALLGACATRPILSAQQESYRYRSHAPGDYTPPGPASDPWGPYIQEAAAKFDVPERWIREVMRQESGGKLYHGGTLVTSGAGAMGLMQVMPATYDELRRRYPDLTDDPYDPHNSILAGTAYIREMYDIYGSPGFLAAYNAGPGRMDDYLTRNRTLPEETRRYMASIGPRISGTEPRNPSPGQQYAMNATPYSIPAGPRYAAGERSVAPTYITLNPPSPLPAPAPVPAPVAVAASEPLPAPVRTAAATAPSGSPFIVLRPQPAADVAALTEVAALPEPLRVQPPAPTVAPRDASIPAVFVPLERTSSRPTQFAQIPEPPPPPPRSQQQLAAGALVPLSPRSGGFSLIAPAHAEPLAPRRSGFSAGGWSVQVGAYANEGLAASANLSAREHAYEFLGGARPTITPVREPRGTLYRARLGGLSRDTATQACERIVRTHGTCMLISPDAQS